MTCAKAGDIFEQVVASEIDYLTEALQTLDRQALNGPLSCCAAINGSLCFGLGPSISLVDHA